MTHDERPGLSGVTPPELEAWVVAQGQPAYRARQIADAFWAAGGTTDAASIAPLPPALRTALGDAFRFDTVGDTELRVADGGLTEKALHKLDDGALIELVLMHYPARGAQPRAPHPVHLEPGRLRRRLPVLRHGGARVHPRPLRPPRSSTRSVTPRGGWLRTASG